MAYHGDIANSGQSLSPYFRTFLHQVKYDSTVRSVNQSSFDSASKRTPRVSLLKSEETKLRTVVSATELRTVIKYFHLKSLTATEIKAELNPTLSGSAPLFPMIEN